MPILRRRIAAIAVGAGMLLLLAVGLLGLQFSDSVRRLSHAPQDNAIWAIFQLEYEMERTRTAIAELKPNDEESRKVFLNRFDIFYSRYDTIVRARGFRLDSTDELQSREWREIEAFVNRITPAIDQNSATIGEHKEALSQAFTNMVPIVRRFAVATVQETNKKNAQLHHSLSNTVGLAGFLLMVLLTGLVGVIAMLLKQASALQLGQRALKDSEQLNRAITTASLDGVIVFDRSGNIIEFNQSSAEIFGLRRDHALGNSIFELLAPSRLKRRLRSLLERADGDAGEGRRLEVRLLGGGGREIPIELSLRALQGEKGLMFVAFARDITSRKADARRLQQARELAEAESARKARYAAFVSHEIRTPLNSLLLVIDLLRSPNPAREREELLTSAASAAEALLGIVNEVLDFSRIEAGAVSLASAPQTPSALLQQAAEVAMPLARHRGNEIVMELDPLLGAVMVDGERLKQVMLNLIANAVKATENGRITLSARLLRRMPTLDIVEFSVADTGSGIAPERLGQIFEEFATFGAAAPARLTGAGLGLPIARRLIAAMGGDIEVESTLGKGSRFHFCLRLPSASDVLKPATPVAAVDPVADTGQLRVLVVDDDDLNRMALERVLAKAGHKVSVAASGEEGLQAARTRVFDVIFIDQLMPGLDGVETVRRIRALGPDGSARARIIIVTAYATEQDKARLRAVGADDYLPKPLRRLAVEQALQRRPAPAGEPVDA